MSTERYLVLCKPKWGLPADTYLLLTTKGHESYQLRDYVGPVRRSKGDAPRPPDLLDGKLKDRFPDFSSVKANWKKLFRDDIPILLDKDIKDVNRLPHWFGKLNRANKAKGL